MANPQIITIYPKLGSTEVEWNGNKFNCTQCGVDDCCGTVGETLQNKAVCEKCRCQNLYGATDDTRNNNEKLKQLECKDCTPNSTLSKDYCDSLGFLENNLQPQIVDCSNTMLVTGKYNQINDVSLESSCNIESEKNVNVFKAEDTREDGGGSIMKYALIGGAILFIIIILFIIF